MFAQIGHRGEDILNLHLMLLLDAIIRIQHDFGPLGRPLVRFLKLLHRGIVEPLHLPALPLRIFPDLGNIRVSEAHRLLIYIQGQAFDVDCTRQSFHQRRKIDGGGSPQGLQLAGASHQLFWWDRGGCQGTGHRRGALGPLFYNGGWQGHHLLHTLHLNIHVPRPLG